VVLLGPPRHSAERAISSSRTPRAPPLIGLKHERRRLMQAACARLDNDAYYNADPIQRTPPIKF